MFDHPLCIKVFPNIKSETPLAQLLTIPICPVTRYQGERTSTSLSTLPSSVESSLLFSKPDKTKFPRHFPHDMASSSFTNLPFIIFSVLKLHHDLVKGWDCPARPCTGVISPRVPCVVWGVTILEGYKAIREHPKED